MTPKEELRDLVSSSKLTLAETFDLGTRVPKDFKELYEFHKKEFPGYPVMEPPAGPDVAILSFSDLPTHRLFLSMIEKAISLRFGHTVKIITGTGWERARLVIAPDYGIWGDPHLSKNYKEGDAGAQPHLGQVPLFLLTDLALYMREPKLKRSLWNALCQQIQKIGSPKS